VWARSSGVSPSIQAALRPAGQGSFGSPQDLSLGGQTASPPQVAVSPNGTAIAVWTRSDGTTPVIQAAVKPAGQAGFDAAQTISQAGRIATRLQVAVAPDGTATAVWQRQNDGSTYTIQGAMRPVGAASSGAVQNLSVPEAGRNANVPQVAVAPDGAATAAWERDDGSRQVIQSATRPAGQATFEATENRSQSGQHAFGPQVAMGIDGATTIAWRRSDGATYIPQATTRAAGQLVFGAVQNLAPAGEDVTNDPQLGVAPDGAVTMAWASAGIIRTATRPAGEAGYTTPMALSLVGQAADNPQVAVGLDGAATAVWERSNGSELIAQGTGSSATTYPLTVQSQGPGTVTSSPTGIACGTGCSASFPLSSSVTLTATPEPGGAFADWGGS